MTTSPELKRLLEQLAQTRNLDLRGYKPTTLERRIRRRMQQIDVKSYQEYSALVREKPAEADELLNLILIGVTHFFRDPEAWDALRLEALPAVLRDSTPAHPFRAWCAGCSTGQEAYSVAITIAEYLGPGFHEKDIKIYATDSHDSALTVARRAQYGKESLQRVPAELRAKYFQESPGGFRVNRDIRKMVIFGRSNLLTDAPISRVKLLVCRNVLIYFNIANQEQVMARFGYALEAGGVLFLGKAESQLKNTSCFVPFNSRWRIFRRTGVDSVPQWQDKTKRWAMQAENQNTKNSLADKQKEELAMLRLYHKSLLETLEPAILVLDSRHTVIDENDAMGRLWQLSDKLTGKPVGETALWQRSPEFRKGFAEFESSRGTPQPVRFDCPGPAGKTISVTMKPILSESGKGQVGTLIYMEDIGPRAPLQTTVLELATTAEELQAANEELELTNEELQSTNEELETTNEELQATNEELETTNEELQSLNTELETINDELVSKGKELENMTARYAEMIERMPWPVLLVNEDRSIYLFNSSCQQMFGFATPSERGMHLEEIPLPNQIRNFLIRRYEDVLRTHKPQKIRNKYVEGNRIAANFDIHMSPLSASSSKHGVLIMFERLRETGDNGNSPGAKRDLAARKGSVEKPSKPAYGKSRQITR